MCNDRSAFPESELRNTFVVDADGTMGRHVSPPTREAKVLEEMRAFVARVRARGSRD